MKNKILLIALFLSGNLITTVYAQTGNVGIGTNSPTEKLDVNGNIKASTFSTIWSASIAYTLNYVVLYEGSFYKHLTTSNTATTPNMDGTNWKNLTSPITITEPLTITASITNPVKSSVPNTDYISLVDDGSGWCTVTFKYNADLATGASAGNGFYIFNLPSGYSFDTSIHEIETSASSTSIWGWDNHSRVIEGSSALVGYLGIYPRVSAIWVHSANTFKIATIQDFNSYVTNSHFSITNANIHYGGSFRFKKAP